MVIGGGQAGVAAPLDLAADLLALRSDRVDLVDEDDRRCVALRLGEDLAQALLGLAVGDAVRTTLEFQPPGTFVPISDMVGGGPFALAPGQWTDDTSMALCLAESLVDRGTHDPADQMRRYVRWWKEGYFSPTGRCFDIGGTTGSQLGRFVRTGRPVDDRVDEEAAANGSLMRLAPVSIRWSHDAEAVVLDIPTHDVLGVAPEVVAAGKDACAPCTSRGAVTGAVAQQLFHPFKRNSGRSLFIAVDTTEQQNA